MEHKQSNTTNNNKKTEKCTADWLLPIVGASGLSCPQEDINVGANIYFPNLHNSIISHWTMKQHCKQSKATGTGQATATTKAPGRLPALPWSVCSHWPSVWVLPPTYPDSVVVLLAYPLCHYPCHDAYWCFCWCWLERRNWKFNFASSDFREWRFMSSNIFSPSIHKLISNSSILIHRHCSTRLTQYGNGLG